MRSIAWAVMSSGLAIAGCGGGTNDAAPRLIPGGGVGDGAIDGVLNVHVIDGDTDAPIAGATVQVGEPGEPPLEGLTDSSGLIAFDDGSLSGGQTITVVAGGHVVSTWFGANGANVTIPVDPTSTVPTDVPRAQLSGTIAGWDDLPAPETGHLLIAGVGYSQTGSLDDPENQLPQPPPMGTLPANACVKTAQASQCAWRINARTGTIALYAVIADRDLAGTPDDPSDDTVAITGFAYALGVVVVDGVDQSGIQLTQLDAGDIADVTVIVAPLPAELDQAGVLMMLDLGDQGVLPFGGEVEDGALTQTVPGLSGPFAEASYRATGFARVEGFDNGPASVVFERDVTRVDSPIQLDAWLELPGELAVGDGVHSFAPVDAASLHIVDFIDVQERTVWGVALLDGRTEFTLPGLDPDPLPSGGFDMRVNAFDVDVNLRNFAIDDLADAVDRTSANRDAFAR